VPVSEKKKGAGKMCKVTQEIVQRKGNCISLCWKTRLGATREELKFTSMKEGMVGGASRKNFLRKKFRESQERGGSLNKGT